jgi:hypothetical protein
VIILIIILSLVLVGATVSTLFRVGEKDGICNYDYLEE